MKQKKRIAAIAVVIALVASLMAGSVALAGAGDSDDPLVSLSYLTSVFKQDIMSAVDSKIESAVSSRPASSSSGSAYVATHVLAGQTIRCGEGTELILRSGEAISVCPGSNGIVDATSGIDLLGGLSVSKNHVYIIPRDDGRGIKMVTEGYVMIKGSYKLV